jgi:hypothetical protein
MASPAMPYQRDKAEAKAEQQESVTNKSENQRVLREKE